MYYPVDLSIVEGEVLNDGRKAMDVLRDLPGIREASWGGIYLPEETLEIEGDPFLAWLYEQNAVGVHGIPESEIC